MSSTPYTSTKVIAVPPSTSKCTWGILEFSPEMGTESVPNDFMRDIARKWVEHECVAITDVM